ncbi:T9SS sorting signal type C domain-containing protein [Flavobacterium glaciei]|uniref:PKD-like domain-containing protein n=1 Tax=Flavobacterium glaciei TaxID=386300 RepID=A0A562PXS5_9FLAO|nr:T9SS sorting signal type C domain-containing protein [Flavobacterium glaciei]RDI56644.1 hypothetical protein DFR66_104210 [Flavobacterium glaciei]TWI49214.1 hypothetical protein IQ02_01203 [Flavobacterium glaciei]
MNKKILLSITCLLCALSTYSQCAYTGTPLTSVNTTPYTFSSLCIGTPINSGNVRAGQYALVNVLQGFRYRFSVGNLFSDNENLTILNAIDDSNFGVAGFASGTNGASIMDWVSPITGQIKVLVSRGACVNNNTVNTAGPIIMFEVARGNATDDQTAMGVNQWVGHVYGYSGGVSPGGTSPNHLSTSTVPFITANYEGFITVPSETINTTFGGGAVCLPITRNGAAGTTVYTDTFAVRYRMRSTRPAGCYILNVNGDDGVRVYVDGVLVFNRWVDQGNTTYCNNLINLTGNSVIVLDYYENAGGNRVGFSLAPFDGSGNAITSSADVGVCSNTPSTITATNLISCNVNTNTVYQWQSSLDNITFTNISGATNRDYTAPAVVVTTTDANNVRYFRRVFKPNALTAVACEFFSNVVTVTTSGAPPALPGTITGDLSQCISSTARYSIAPVPNAVSYNWTTTGLGWTITPDANGLSVTVAFIAGATSGNLQVTATNGCNTSAPRVATVTISTVVNTWNGSVWSTGLTPTSTPKQRIVFAGNFNQNVDLVACSCLVTGSAAVTINENRTLLVTNEVEVVGGAVLTFENNASLVQENNNASNLGNIVYKRRTNLIDKFDYTYWSSPVFNQRLLDVSPETLFDKFFSFNASTDTWQQESTSNSMDVGKGYIIRGPQFFPAPNPPSGIHEAIFVGRPNNGIIGIAIPFISSDTSNLIGNPYPSAIDADLFLAANNLILDGTLYFWTHNSPPSNAIPGDATYNYTSDDYASYNGVGGVATLPAFLGGVTPSGKIATGQAFFATGIAAGTAVFNNGMRVSGGPLGQNNSQFFKTNNTKSKGTNSVEKHRIWLNLTNTQGAFKQMLVGYVTNATNGFDKAYDGQSFDGNEFIDFYSINDDKNLTIQGRALPFDKNDEVALGYSSTIEGAFSISIDQVDGILISEDVFIEDKMTNAIKNLKEGAYNFSTKAGSFNDRFVLRYKDKTLGTGEFETADNNIIISVKNKQIKIDSQKETIDKVLIFDLLGKQIFRKLSVENNEHIISNLPSSEQVLIVKVVLQNGQTVSKKIIF